MKKGMIVIAAVAVFFLVSGIVCLAVVKLADEDDNGSRKKLSRETARVGAEERQVIISLGETPDSVCISWKGTDHRHEFLRVSRNKKRFRRQKP